MKKQDRFMAASSILLVIGFLAGCAKMPQDAMDAAVAALDSAKATEAELYLPEMYQAAQDSFAAAQAEIEIQNGKLAPSRSYTRTRKILNATAAAANAAANAVPARKEQMRSETESILANLPKSVREVDRLVQRAAGRRATREAATAAREALAGVNKMLADARTALGQGDLVTAHEQATRAQQAVEQARKQVS